MHSEAALPIGRVKTIAYTDNGDGAVQGVTYEGVPQYGPTVVQTAVVAHPVAHAMLLFIQLLFSHKLSPEVGPFMEGKSQ